MLKMRAGTGRTMRTTRKPIKTVKTYYFGVLLGEWVEIRETLTPLRGFKCKWTRTSKRGKKVEREQTTWEGGEVIGIKKAWSLYRVCSASYSTLLKHGAVELEPEVKSRLLKESSSVDW